MIRRQNYNKNDIKHCPECAGIMRYESKNRSLVCHSCGLLLKHSEYYNYWNRVKNGIGKYANEYERKRVIRKDWLKWYESSKVEKVNY